MDGGQELLEREAALARIERRLRDAIARRGSLLSLEGPAGIGKRAWSWRPAGMAASLA